MSLAFTPAHHWNSIHTDLHQHTTLQEVISCQLTRHKLHLWHTCLIESKCLLHMIHLFILTISAFRCFQSVLVLHDHQTDRQQSFEGRISHRDFLNSFMRESDNLYFSPGVTNVNRSDSSMCRCVQLRTVIVLCAIEWCGDDVFLKADFEVRLLQKIRSVA